MNQELRGSIKMAVDNAEHHHKNIIRRLVPLYNALQDFGPPGLVKKAHYLGNKNGTYIFAVSLRIPSNWQNLHIILLGYNIL